MKQTIEFLENLKNISKKKSEINLYKLFVEILQSVETLELSADKMKNISKELDILNIDSIQEKQYKYIKAQFITFTKFLETEYSLIQKGHYIGLGMSLGMVFGLALAGIIGYDFGMGNETTGGLISGMVVGMFIGVGLDKKAEKENRVLIKK